jgi:hypothetical protein
VNNEAAMKESSIATTAVTGTHLIEKVIDADRLEAHENVSIGRAGARP